MSLSKKAVPRGATAHPGKYLTFELGNEFYGIEILKIQEIIGLMDVTHLPRTPDFVRGVINLRGRIIPVVDLRAKFGLPRTDDTERTCIVVVQVAVGDTPLIMGLLVDEVSEVINFQAEMLEPAPSFGGGVDVAFLLGLAKVNGKVVMLLDVDRILADTEMHGLQEMSMSA